MQPTPMVDAQDVRRRGVPAVLETVAQISASVIRDNAEAVDREARWPEESIRALLAAGLGGLVVPTAVGGLGLGLAGLAQSCEQIASECASSAICFGMHCVGSAVIAAKATPPQVEEFLRPIAAGRHLTTLALSEPGTGSSFYIPQTKLGRDGDDLHIVGQKSFVTNGGHADSYVISVASGLEVGTFSCAVLPGDAQTLTWGTRWNGFGMRGNASRGVTIDARIPGRLLLGEEDDEIWYVFNVVAPYFLTSMSGTYIGVAASSLRLATEHLRTRTFAHTGSGLAANSVIQYRLGELWAELQRARRLLYWAADEAEAGGDDALAALCSAKAEVGTSAVNIANEAMTMVGGMGYGENSRLARNLRDARAAHVMAPTTDQLRIWTGRALLGMPLLAE